MKQPRRFTATPSRGLEGRLLALGKEEAPNPEAKHRVARHLGISAGALASAAAAAAATTSAKAAAAASGVTAAKSLGAAMAPATSSFVAATIVKATVIGVGLGLVSYAGVKGYVAHSSPAAPSIAAHENSTTMPAERAQAKPNVVPEASLENAPIVEANGARVASQSLRSQGTVEPMAVDPEAVPDPNMHPVARFDDEEPPTALHAEPSSATGHSAPSVPAATALPSGSALPADPRLAREVTSLDLARASARRGDAAGALRELTAFERNYGYVALRREAMLVHIDGLLSLGRRVEAAAIARHLLQLGAPATQRTRLEELVRGQP